MKYGLILHNYGNKAKQNAGFNIGDPIQSIALEKLYCEMQIHEDEIVKINMCDLQDYAGEYVLLPMLGVALGVGFAPLPLSPKIIPLFISSHFVINTLTNEQVDYLRSYSPIGCRDEYSLNTMRRYNIPAYLSGCITTLFEQRKLNVGEGKNYFIDIPSNLQTYIPDSLKENAVYETHLLPIENSPMTVKDAENYLDISRERIELYKKTANIVVSSRMHALVPCMAMGIPVIAVFDNLSYRFSWLDKYIPLYTEENFCDINWNPTIVNYEDTKQSIKNVFIKSIQEAYNKYKGIYKVSDFYENRNRYLYGNRYYKKIKDLNIHEDEFNYIIWGCGLIGNVVYDIMSMNFPKAHLKVAVDEYLTGTWHDVEIIKSKDLRKYPNCYILLSTYSGREQGYAVMNELGKIENKDFVYLGTING